MESTNNLVLPFVGGPFDGQLLPVRRNEHGRGEIVVVFATHPEHPTYYRRSLSFFGTANGTTSDFYIFVDLDNPLDFIYKRITLQ